MGYQQLLTVLSVVVPVVLFYLYDRLKWLRFKQFGHLKTASEPSLLFGHLPLIKNARADKPNASHHDYVFDEIRKSAGYPEFMIVDMRPVQAVIGLVSTHDLNEQISRSTKQHPYSVGKPPVSQLIHLVGKRSIIFAENEEWKSLRKRYNPAFAPNHLLTLIPQILEKSRVFVRKLEQLATAQEEVCMGEICTTLTFDIIGVVVLDTELLAQNPRDEQSELVRLFRDQIKSYTRDENLIFGFFETPKRKWDRYIRGRRIESILRQLIREKYAGMREQRSQLGYVKSRSVLALSVANGEEELTPELLQISLDQVRSFLLAGHDTTSTLLQRVFYALSIHPKTLATARAEIHSIFQTDDPSEIADILLERGDEAYGRMSYTSAVIKEALRLWPPAGTGRRALAEEDFTLKMRDGSRVDVSGMILYGMHYSVMRDPAVYGDTANDFIPERWLGDTSTASDDPDHAKNSVGASDNTNVAAANGSVDFSQAKEIPASAWRPFERGPRNCIGQELANIEVRVILALVLQRFDFEKVGIGAPKLDKETGKPFLAGGDGGVAGIYELDSDLYNMSQVTAKPVDGMMMKVRFAAEA